MTKMNRLHLYHGAVVERLEDLRRHAAYHGKATQAVIDAQLAPAAARQLTDAGGGVYVVNTVQALLKQLLEASDESR